MQLEPGNQLCSRFGRCRLWIYRLGFTVLSVLEQALQQCPHPLVLALSVRRSGLSGKFARPLLVLPRHVQAGRSQSPRQRHTTDRQLQGGGCGRHADRAPRVSFIFPPARANSRN